MAPIWLCAQINSVADADDEDQGVVGAGEINEFISGLLSFDVVVFFECNINPLSCFLSQFIIPASKLGRPLVSPSRTSLPTTKTHLRPLALSSCPDTALHSTLRPLLPVSALWSRSSSIQTAILPNCQKARPPRKSLPSLPEEGTRI